MKKNPKNNATKQLDKINHYAVYESATIVDTNPKSMTEFKFYCNVSVTPPPSPVLTYGMQILINGITSDG